MCELACMKDIMTIRETDNWDRVIPFYNLSYKKCEFNDTATIVTDIYAATQRNSSAKLLNREKKMAAICILGIFTSDVTLQCIICRR